MTKKCKLEKKRRKKEKGKMGRKTEKKMNRKSGMEESSQWGLR